MWTGHAMKGVSEGTRWGGGDMMLVARKSCASLTLNATAGTGAGVDNATGAETDGPGLNEEFGAEALARVSGWTEVAVKDCCAYLEDVKEGITWGWFMELPGSECVTMVVITGGGGIETRLFGLKFAAKMPEVLSTEFLV
jgi:hypothetical protein